MKIDHKKLSLAIFIGMLVAILVFFSGMDWIWYFSAFLIAGIIYFWDRIFGYDSKENGRLSPLELMKELATDMAGKHFGFVQGEIDLADFENYSILDEKHVTMIFHYKGDSYLLKANDSLNFNYWWGKSSRLREWKKNTPMSLNDVEKHMSEKKIGNLDVAFNTVSKYLGLEKEEMLRLSEERKKIRTDEEGEEE